MKKVNVEVTMTGEVVVTGIKGANVAVKQLTGLNEYVAQQVELAVTEVLSKHSDAKPEIRNENNSEVSTNSVQTATQTKTTKNEKVENTMTKTITIIKHNERMVEFKINEVVCHVGFGRDNNNFFEAYNGTVKTANRADVLKRIANIKADQSMRLQYIIKNLKPVSTKRVQQPVTIPQHVCVLTGKPITDKVASFSLREFGIKLEVNEQRKLRGLIADAESRAKAANVSEPQQESVEVVDADALVILQELQSASEENKKSTITESLKEQIKSIDAASKIPNMMDLMTMQEDELPAEMQDALNFLGNI